ncbi:MAG: ThuA domain-containing protein, partial [Vicinamibacterales bacterium]
PTSGTVFFHTVLPESVLAKGRLPGTTSYKGMITKQNTYPLMTWPEQAYVQIDQVGQFTAAAGCAVYDGGAWPDKWRYAYFTGEPTVNLVHQQFVKPDGVSYTTEKEVGREQTEFMRSKDLWFRPIETRVGPDGALYVVDFYNQAVIHNDTRGPLHGPANAAVRPDRDHYFGRIWRVQHKQARTLAMPVLNRQDLPGLIRVMQTSPNAFVKQTAWRLAQENHASDPQLARIKRPMGSQALQAYEQARTATTPVRRTAVLDAFAAATDNWTRSALIAAASDQASLYVTEALGHARRATLNDFVTAVVPAALPEHAARLLDAAAGAPPDAAPLKATVVRAVARMEGGAVALDARTTTALQKLLDDPSTRSSAVPVAARWDKSGVLAAKVNDYGGLMLRELASSATSDAVRIEDASSLLAVPARRAAALSAITPMLSDPVTPAALRAGLTTALGENPGSDIDVVLIDALARTNATPLFDQILKRPASSLALLAAMKEGTITPARLGPGNVARLRTHPDKNVAVAAAALLDSLAPAAKAKADLIAALLPEVEKPGDVAVGRTLFLGACSSCHKLGDIGKSDAGPPLNGIGAHPRAELLAHIVDPNRQVDPSFWQWNITTRQKETLVGVIARENDASLTLRGPAGEVEVKKADIATRENTRRSLMPEGFEALGGEALRNIVSFLAASQTPAPAPAVESQGPREGGRGDGPLPETTPIVWAAGKTKVLIIGGGSSHDFGRFFGGTDRATLAAAGFSVNYTEDRDQAAAEIGKADVAVISVNRQFFDTPAYRKALVDFANAGKGLVMLHPGTWYGFAQWPELNATIVGGGARGHDRIAKFSVNAKKPDHPVMKGVPASFDVEDELYYLNAEADKIPPGTASIEVLAETSPSVRFKQPHPAVYVTSHPTARIVGITLGHDERVHDHQAFRTLLVNAVKWVGRTP